MRARLIAMAVAYAYPLMTPHDLVTLIPMTTWPHGYARNPFLARGPLRIPKGV